MAPICRLFPFPAPTCWPCLRVACGHVCQLLRLLAAPAPAPTHACTHCCSAGSWSVVAACLWTIFGAFLLIYAKLWHFSIAFYTRPASFATSSGSCLRAPGLRGPVSFRLFVLYNFHTFVQLLPPKCATHLPRLFHLEEQHLHRTRLPVCLPASHAHRPQPPPLVLALNCILLPQIQMRKCVCVCVLGIRVSTISTLGFAHLMPSYNFHVGCFSSFHPDADALRPVPLGPP